MKNPITYIFSLFSLIALTAMGQTEIVRATRLLSKSDSVILISHLTTDENHDKLPGIVLPPGKVNDTKPIVFPSFFMGKNINQAIIVQRKLLAKQDVIALINIIQKPVKRSGIGYISLCFEPHHAVLIYNKSKFSYIDFCFHCSALVTSSDLKLSNMDFQDGKWEEMKTFFLNHGMTYEMGDND